MNSPHIPSTPAVLMLKAALIPFSTHFYTYEEKGGTATSSRALGVNEHEVIKTLIMADEKASPLIVLMHGDLQVSTKNLARHLGVKHIEPCSALVAQRHSGYLVGGTSPFGTRKKMPVYVQNSIWDLPHIYINGGRRGFLVRITPDSLTQLLPVTPVNVAITT